MINHFKILTVFNCCCLFHCLFLKLTINTNFFQIRIYFKTTNFKLKIIITVKLNFNFDLVITVNFIFFIH